MISLLIYNCKPEETALIKKISSHVVAYNSDEKLNLCYELEQKTPVDLAVVNICGAKGMDAVRAVRAKYPRVDIMLISDISVSPMQYLTPAIRPASLMISPYGEEELRTKLSEFISTMFSVEEGELWVDGSSGKTKVPFASILYVEARNKMLSIRLESMEYSVYGTLEQFAEKLPGYFRRCHRAVIVNTRYVQSIRFSENYIKLKNGETIPLSRSCKQNFKEMMK